MKSDLVAYLKWAKETAGTLDLEVRDVIEADLVLELKRQNCLAIVGENEFGEADSDPWFEPVERHLEREVLNGNHDVTLHTIMSGPLGLPAAERHAASQRRVVAILRELGWEKRRVRLDQDGVKQRTWVYSAPGQA